MSDRRRIKAVTITPDILLRILRNQHESIEIESLPVDAQLKNYGYDQQLDSFYLVMQHESFEVVDSGSRMPHLFLVVKIKETDVTKET